MGSKRAQGQKKGRMSGVGQWGLLFRRLDWVKNRRGKAKLDGE